MLTGISSHRRSEPERNRIPMQNRNIEQLIEELQHLRIRETVVIAQIREAIKGANGAEQENVRDVDHAVIADGLRSGDRVRINNTIRKPATAGPSWNENRERLATITKVTVDQVHIITDNGTKTWRACNNLRLI